MNTLNIDLMPKIELHVHIEGATGSQTYFNLADKNHVELPFNNIRDWENFYIFKNFEHFIEVYGLSVSTIKTAEDFVSIIENFFKYQKSQNIIYTEAFLSASFIIQNFKNDEIIEAIEYGIKKGEKTYGVKVNVIPDISRHLPDTQQAVLDLAISGFKKGIFVGLGLGGLEKEFPPNLFCETFAKAKSSGLHLVAHAGEAEGPKSIWGAIHDLQAERIGHGITCLNDSELIAFLNKSQMPIEVSPTSNYHLGVIDPQEKHPIRKMVDAGLFCTLNTDDPEMFSTNLSNEYKLLHSQGFSYEELVRLNYNALNAAFLDETERSEIKQCLDQYEQLALLADNK